MKNKGWFGKLSQINQELRNEMKEKGYKNLDHTVPFVDFIINPYSRLSFPRSYFERGYTYIREYDLKTGEVRLTYDWRKSAQLVRK